VAIHLYGMNIGKLTREILTSPSAPVASRSESIDSAWDFLNGSLCDQLMHTRCFLLLTLQGKIFLLDQSASFFFFFFLNPIYCPSRRSLTLDFTLLYATPLASSAIFAPASPVILSVCIELTPSDRSPCNLRPCWPFRYLQQIHAFTAVF
jgi:hypothetical protein